jgi:two-component system response regulator ChvI
MAKILLVDDQPEVGKSVRELLAPKGFDVEVVPDAQTALRALGVPPDLALVDLRLPDMDGFQLASRLRQRFSNLRIVMFTGWPSPQDDIHATKMKFYDFLPKSNLYDLLIPTIERVLKSNNPVVRPHPTDPIAAGAQYVIEGKYELASASLEEAARDAEFEHRWNEAATLYEKAADHYGRARGMGSDGRRRLTELAANASRMDVEEI